MRLIPLRSTSTRRKAVALGGLAAFTAVALSACHPVPDKKAQNIVIVGSDTTQDVMGKIAANLNTNASLNPDPDTLYNVRALQNTALTVPAQTDPDMSCASVTYHSPAGAGEKLAPNGSGSGRDALKASVLAGDGCIAVARSSGAPRPKGTGAGQDPASFEYYAYALDAVGAATASTKAPASLTRAQIQGIYNCTYTNWAQVGGTSGAIKRYWPQAGSGTRSFFQSDVLGFDPTASIAACTSANSPIILTEENTGATIAANGDLQSAIVPHSAGQWVAQAHGTSPDTRNGLRMISLNGENLVYGSGAQSALNTPAASGDANAPVVETNVTLNNPTPTYPGIRYVYNVLDNTSKTYNQASYYFGFTNAAGDGAWASNFCSGGQASTIADYGFAPLGTNDIGGHNLAGSTCRVYLPQ